MSSSLKLISSKSREEIVPAVVADMVMFHFCTQTSILHQSKQQEFVSSQCGNCGRSHQKEHCLATGKRCKFCHKLSHFEIVCRQKQKEMYATEPETDLFIGTLDVQELNSNNETRELQVHEIDRITVGEEEWNVELEFGEKIKLNIDTGAKCNIIPWNIYKSLKLRNHMMCPSDIKLFSYSGDKIDTCRNFT